MEGTSMCDLPADLVAQEILTRVPITSLTAVRSTCKLWDSLSKDWILGKAAAARQHQFLGFMTKNSKVCSLRFHLCRRSSKDKEDEDKDVLDLSVKQVDLLNQVEISRVFHCEGLVLCVAKDNSRLLMWNPYLGQTQWIGFPTGFDRRDCYALGYDINRNHKILRFLGVYGRAAERRFEIYEFSSNSWTVLKVTPDCDVDSHHGGVSLKGNAYFYAREFANHEDKVFGAYRDSLLCFDFTTERFGPRLPLPFHNVWGDNVALSCLKEEKLVVLDQRRAKTQCSIVKIWITNTIEPNYVSWSKFLKVEMKPFAYTAPKGIRICHFFSIGSFFIDEEEKVAVVFDLNAYLPEKDNYHPKALVIEKGEYLKSVYFGAHKHDDSFRGCSSSYLPSLVQLNQSHTGKEPGKVPPPPPTLPATGQPFGGLPMMPIQAMTPQPFILAKLSRHIAGDVPRRDLATLVEPISESQLEYSRWNLAFDLGSVLRTDVHTLVHVDGFGISVHGGGSAGINGIPISANQVKSLVVGKVSSDHGGGSINLILSGRGDDPKNGAVEISSKSGTEKVSRILVIGEQVSLHEDGSNKKLLLTRVDGFMLNGIPFVARGDGQECISTRMNEDMVMLFTTLFDHVYSPCGSVYGGFKCFR